MSTKETTLLSLNTKIMWRLKGRGSWVVEDTERGIKHLFKYKTDATTYSSHNGLSEPYKR